MDRGSFRFALLAIAGFIVFFIGVFGNATKFIEMDIAHALTLVGGFFGLTCQVISMLKYNAAQRAADNVSP